MSAHPLSFAVLAAALALAPAPAAAAGAPSPWYAEFSLGGGLGAARVEGARLEFGRDRFAVGLGLHGGRQLNDHVRVGLHLDAVGAGSGRVVLLSSAPGSVAGTTQHRVAINHLSVVAGVSSASGLVFARVGGGIAESFTEDYDDPHRAVRRSFGPGAVAGIGVSPRLPGGARLPIAVDAMVGDYDGRTGWGAMLTVGIANR